NSINLSITTTGVSAVLYPSNPGVLCDMVRGRASGGARVERRKTCGRKRAEEDQPWRDPKRRHDTRLYGRRRTGVTGDGGPRLHLGTMRHCIEISLRMPTMPAPSSRRTA
ncbi:MAG: hypothetical protein AB7P69_23220, partial [Candidatus Binatia bacterium]